jgi:7,8-dihydro-6-hydroxymethylpterin dimethyltransferase
MKHQTKALLNSQKAASAMQDECILPIKTQSLCPECLCVIDAVIHEEGGMVYMDKSCPQHGPCREIISDDPKFYTLMFERDRATLRKATNALKEKQLPCPRGCGLCSEHRTSPVMHNIDLTNRCNLKCPVCFANADACGFVIEPTIDQLRVMLDKIFQINEVPPPCFQFTGGEPTVHPEFFQALREVKKRNFAQVQIATNGIKFANNPEFAAEAADAGLNIAYLQFDGLDDKVYMQTRGKPLLDIKMSAIDNLHKAGVRILLVPTIVRGINDHQVGDIARFAVQNPEKIAGISWQPVSFTGRIDYQQRIKQRFTITDLARQIQNQTGLLDMYRDWYPFGVTDPFSKFLEAVCETPQSNISCSPSCGAAAYLIVDPAKNEFLPLTSFVDVEPLMDELTSMTNVYKKKKIFRKLSIARGLKKLNKYYHQERGPTGWTFETFVEFMTDFANFRQRFDNNQARYKTVADTSHRVILMASMHFQDAYNFQIDRIKRCAVLYCGMDGRMYPFCSYNGGPCHRNKVEKQFAIPIAQYKNMYAKD